MGITINPKRAEELNNAALRRMRWKLWFCFAESKYDTFRENDNPKRPHYKNIDAYCLKHWGKKIGEMTKTELSKYISLISKWK